MTSRAWPSREEWQAKAEYAVRTACTKYERLDQLQPDAMWSTLAEDAEFEELALPAAAQIRTLLTPEIARLRELLPSRPDKTRARAAWFVALEGQAYEDACNLGALEAMRREVHRARREKHWGHVCWELGRLRRHYPSVVLPEDLLKAHDRMLELQGALHKRRDAAAEAAEQAAVDAEVVRRATDEAWAKELERRAAIDHPRDIHVGHNQLRDGDRMT